MVPLNRILPRCIRTWSRSPQIHGIHHQRLQSLSPSLVPRTSRNYCFYDRSRLNLNLSRAMVNRKLSTKNETVLYKIDGSPPARATMMIIDILGIDVRMEDLNPVFREQDEPPFIQMNPMRTIPILDEGDFSLADSHAIMIYLLDKYGKPEHEDLYPKDSRKRATVNQRLFFECGIVFPRLRAIMAPTYQGRLTELTKFMIINNEDAYQMMEDYLNQNLYVAGDTLTLADFSLYTTTLALHGLHPADEKRFPKLRQWLKTMSELDVVKRVNEPGASTQVQFLFKIMAMNKENQKAKL